jgi:hypothetical protein
MGNTLGFVKPSLLAVLLPALLFFVLDLFLPLGWMVWLPYVVLMLRPLWWSDRPSPVLLATLFSAFILISLVVDYFYYPFDSPPKYALFNRAMGIIMLWLIAALVLRQQRSDAERERLIGQLQEALANIKTLRGLLPLCLSCKKIREVNGYWSRIDAYVTKHSLAEFSPGLCPECEDYLKTQMPEEPPIARVRY